MQMSGLSFSDLESPAALQCVCQGGGVGFLYLLIYFYMQLFSAVVFTAN